MNLSIIYDTTISLFGIYLIELCANVQQNTFVRVFTETQALFIVDKNFPNHTKNRGWLNNLWYFHMLVIPL